MKSLFTALLISVFILGCTPSKLSNQKIQASAESVDYGDYTSQTLVSKAWKAFDKKDYPELFAYTNKCIELYAAEGKRMNAELTDFEPPETAAKKWALNDVGTCLWMQANAYVDLKMYPEATRTYEVMAEGFTYSQCWDTKGWFWQPAKGAANRAKQYRYLD